MSFVVKILDWYHKNIAKTRVSTRNFKEQFQKLLFLAAIEKIKKIYCTAKRNTEISQVKSRRVFQLQNLKSWGFMVTDFLIEISPSDHTLISQAKTITL